MAAAATIEMIVPQRDRRAVPAKPLVRLPVFFASRFPEAPVR